MTDCKITEAVQHEAVQHEPVQHESVRQEAGGVAYRHSDNTGSHHVALNHNSEASGAGVRQTLADIPLPFDRDATSIRVVHIGAGRFHRAHEAVYCHELLAQGDVNAGISAVYIMPTDRSAVAAMAAQSGLYTVVERDAKGEAAKVIGSIVEVLDGHADPAVVIHRLADPAVQVVTLTVTEAGYFFDPAHKTLRVDHPAVANDLAHPTQPKTLYGYLAAGLATRRAAGLAPVTIQSCDNIQGNGDLTRALFLAFLQARDEQLGGDLAQWVSEHVTFPNSMVDRITPAADPNEIAYAREQFGCEDQLAVTSESYRQWVIEDNFCNGRPAWEKVGAQFVPSVKPFEQIKIRLLNAGHSAVAYAGYLAGFDTIGDIVGHPQFCDYLKRFFSQVEKTLPPVEGVDIAGYQAKLIERFTNPAIVDQSLRICKDGSARIPGFVTPTLLELLAKRLPVDSFAFLLASYFEFLIQQLEACGVAGIDDPERNTLARLVEQSQGSMAVFLADDALFGDVARYSEFVARAQMCFEKIQAEGVLKALSA